MEGRDERFAFNEKLKFFIVFRTAGFVSCVRSRGIRARGYAACPNSRNSKVYFSRHMSLKNMLFFIV